MKRENQKIILVTGKGGVGKSAVAAAVAMVEARKGRRVLLAELGERSFYRHLFPGAGGHQPVSVTDGVDAALWEGERCLKEYIQHYLRVETLVDLFFNNRVMKSFVNAAPALRELALLGKITSGIRGIGPDLPYDVVVVDAFSTGHFRALLLASVGMAEVVRFGPMGEQSRNMAEVISNAIATQVILVTLPEELPMNETDELRQFLHEKFRQRPTVVINRNLPIPLSAEELEDSRQKAAAMTEPPLWLPEFVAYLQEQGGRQEAALARAKKWNVPVVELPHYLTVKWPDLLRAMANDLEAKWPRG